MPRIVDLDQIGEKSNALLQRGCSAIEYAISLINEIREAPTVDAEPVVRCRDCGMSRETEDEEFVFCMQFRDTVHGQAFCSYGERKDGGE